jgi:hypothetical protein
MCMRLTGIGSQYLIAMHGGDGEFPDGNRNYRMTLPPDIPESRFWSGASSTTTKPARCSKPTGPCPASGARRAQSRPTSDGSTDVYIGPTAPDGKQPMQAKRGTPAIGRVEIVDVRPWLQTVPGEGFFTVLRLYNPLRRSSTSPGGRADRTAGLTSTGPDANGDVLEAPVWLMAEWPDREG